MLQFSRKLEKGKWRTNQVRIEGEVASVDILMAAGKEKGEEDQRGPHDHPELTLISCSVSCTCPTIF